MIHVQMQIHKHTNTNTQIHKYKYTNTPTLEHLSQSMAGSHKLEQTQHFNSNRPKELFQSLTNSNIFENGVGNIWEAKLVIFITFLNPCSRNFTGIPAFFY